MANSYNGWEAISNSGSNLLTVIEPVPGRKFRVRAGDVASLLNWVIIKFHKHVEPIDQGVLDDWGWAYRKTTGGGSISNHASGTAVDINATRHPYGTKATKNFTADQIRAIEALLSVVNKDAEVVRWLRDHDPMHFEINYQNRGGTPANVAAAVRRLSTPDGGAPAPVPTPPANVGSREPRAIDYNNPDEALVRITQEIVGAKVDGIRGNDTKRKTLASQKALGVSGADTLFGPKHALAFLLSVGNLYKSKPDSEMNRAAVKLVQWIGGVNPDGSFGDGTDIAVKEMQSWAGLSPDGNVGDDTKRKIVR